MAGTIATLTCVLKSLCKCVGGWRKKAAEEEEAGARQPASTAGYSKDGGKKKVERVLIRHSIESARADWKDFPATLARVVQ